ncbi:adenosine nucleotide hydrolase NudE [Methylophilaceae bacterium]
MLTTLNDLTESCIATETIRSGGMLTLKVDQVSLPSGRTAQREYVVHPGASVVVALLPNGHVLLEKQFRYPLHQVFIELPAGKIDASEAPLLTAQRELLEETGYSANEWVALGSQHPCIGYSDEVIHMYLAMGLTSGQHKRDEDEALELFDLSFTDCLGLIKSGQISDGKSMLALFMAEQYLAEHPHLLAAR